LNLPWVSIAVDSSKGIYFLSATWGWGKVFQASVARVQTITPHHASFSCIKE
jgi:hypothetical protein